MAGGSPVPVDLVGKLPVGVSALRLERLVAGATRALRLPGVRVAIRFAGDRTLRRYNLRYRGIDRATDVLSFEGGGRGAGGHLGDLLISRDRALIQARAAKLSVQREIEELVLHGVLHLAGHDHDTDQGEMDALELKLRRKLLDPPVTGR